MNRRTFFAAAAAGVGCAALPVAGGDLPVYALEPVGVRLIVYPHPPHTHPLILMSSSALEAWDGVVTEPPYVVVDAECIVCYAEGRRLPLSTIQLKKSLVTEPAVC